MTHFDESPLISPEIEATISLPPTEAINHALGSNHSLETGLDELVDNAIDAQATRIMIVLHMQNLRLVQIGVHDDGIGMTPEKMERVLRVGGHERHSERNIGRYGMGLKEGSFANAEHTTIVSRTKGSAPHGYELSKDSFDVGRLYERSAYHVWNLRSGLDDARHGTSIIWKDLISAYKGQNDDEARVFATRTLERIRLHMAIRYHRFLECGAVKLLFYAQWDDRLLEPTTKPRPINPLGYRRSGHPDYPRRLTLDGAEDGPEITAHLWRNYSKAPEFHLEQKDELGHQGFYFYDHDRLITQGGWSGYQAEKKQLKLLRIEVSDPRILDEHVTVSPQKSSVRLREGFHRFLGRFRDPDNPGISLEDVFADAAEVVRASNQKNSNADPLVEAGRGMAPSIRDVIEDEATLASHEPMNIVWERIPEGDFLRIDRARNTLVLNQNDRELFNDGRGRLNDAPVLKSLLYLLFNKAIGSGRYTSKIQANVELWTAIINASVEEMRQQETSGKSDHLFD
ncbi:ATP-binding protein [Corynebacterium hylobatis]|uniref:ATP-binding protein n=1 Tax=Corynebacterium hylobatis TaxID=1859290 RepID=A0A430I1T4_9CORY|nr:ATP-binding protein [Corynebacterium hylobatis]RSZ66016.1 ATP-binding protein [Corynebacterium hylobatis]